MATAGPMEGMEVSSAYYSAYASCSLTIERLSVWVFAYETQLFGEGSGQPAVQVKWRGLGRVGDDVVVCVE